MLFQDSTLTAVLMTAAAACILGVVRQLMKAADCRRDARVKIQSARSRRAEGMRRAEEAVQQYMSTHPTDSSSILKLSLSELREQLQKGLLTPEAVLCSYMGKALAVNTELNCCTEVLLDSFEQLDVVDSCKDGLLYGVPISIKDNVSYKNYDNTLGLAHCLEKPAQEDSVLVQVLKKQGAIPFVKTNVPQTLISYDCSNPIYGHTRNPHNYERSPGGSSGGEAALIAGGGSLLGIGTDAGGSIRVPASFSGICGLKPTTGRLSLKGVVATMKGQKGVHSSVGPMAKDVDSLALFMQALLCDYMFALDPTVPPIPFNVEAYRSTKPLRIGYLENDGYTEPSPSMARALREVKALLEKAGHTLVSYKPQKVQFALPELVLKSIFADGGASLAAKLEGEPLDPCLKSQSTVYRTPLWLKRTLSFLFSFLSPRLSANVKALCGVGSIPELWDHHVAIEDYSSETIAYWRRCNIDVLLYPVLGPAYRANDSGKIPTSISSLIIYNLLNFPAGVVPVSTVTAEDEEELKHYKGNYQDRFDRLFKQTLLGGEGLPLAVQCIALPWQEEVCLRFMREVEMLVKESRK